MKNAFEWHRWFAWYPVDVGTRRVWLRTIMRRKQVNKSMNFTADIYYWEYKLIS